MPGLGTPANPGRRRLPALADHDGFILVFWHERIRHALAVATAPCHDRLQSPHPTPDARATVNHLGVRREVRTERAVGLRGLKRLRRKVTDHPDGHVARRAVPHGPGRAGVSQESLFACRLVR